MPVWQQITKKPDDSTLVVPLLFIFSDVRKCNSK